MQPRETVVGGGGARPRRCFCEQCRGSMPNPLDVAAVHPAGAHTIAIERAASPVRREAAVPTYRDTTSTIYPAKPSRQEPRIAATRPVSAAFCDVPDPRYARVESMQSQIAIGGADAASVSDLGGGSPKVGTLRIPTAEDLKQPRRRVAARSRSSRASEDGGGDEWDRQSVRSERSYQSVASGRSARSSSSRAPSAVSNASTASTILRARVAELERENATLRDSRAPPGDGWAASPPNSPGATRTGALFQSDATALLYDGQISPRPRTTHDAAPGGFPNTPAAVFEAKIDAHFQARERALKNRHLQSSITFSHNDGGGGAGDAQSPRQALVAQRSKANPKWQGGTPPHQSSGGTEPSALKAGVATGIGVEHGIDRPRSSEAQLGSQRRALDNSSQFTIGAVTGAGSLDTYAPDSIQPVATKRAVASQPALLAAEPRWISTLRTDRAAHGHTVQHVDAFEVSRSASRDAFGESRSASRGRRPQPRSPS